MSAAQTKEIYEFFFKSADVNADGLVEAADAASLFRKSGLSDAVLGSIWAQASQNQPRLDKTKFFMALGLIGLAQAGKEPKTSELGVGKMLVPVFQGVSPPSSSSTTPLQPSISPIVGPVLQPEPSPSVSPSVAPSTPASSPATPVSTITWALTESQKASCANLFRGIDVAQSGVISGKAGRDFFMQSSLPASELAKIWALSDVNADGQLSLPEFQIAFFLTQLKLAGHEIPNPLPMSLFESVGLTPPSNTGSVNSILSTNPNSSSSLPSAIPPQQSSTPPVYTTVVPSSAPVSTSNSLLDMPLPTSNLSQSVDMSSQSHHTTTSSSSFSHLDSTNYMAPSSTGQAPLNNSSPNVSTVMSNSADWTPQSQQSPLYMATSPSSQPTDTTNRDFRLTMRMDPAALRAVLAEEGSPTPAFMLTASGTPSSIPAHLVTTSTASNDWIITPEQRETYESYFKRADDGQTGFVSGAKARDLFTRASLPNQILADIWTLSDITRDGNLNSAEFALAMHLINLCRRGIKLPTSLPPQMLESVGLTSTGAPIAQSLSMEQQRLAMQIQQQKEQEALQAQMNAQAQAAIALQKQQQEQEAIQASLLFQQKQQQQLAMEQQALQAKQEEERQEVLRLKEYIASLLREKERVVQAMRQKQQTNIALAQQLLKADMESDALRQDVSTMELQVEKAKIKGASVKENTETAMRHLNAASEDRNMLEGLISQRRAQVMTETAALSNLESQLNENRAALVRQQQDIQNLRENISSLKKAKDERSTRQFDPHVLQQKLIQEKIKQDLQMAKETDSMDFGHSSSTKNEFITNNNMNNKQFDTSSNDNAWQAFGPSETTIDDFGTTSSNKSNVKPKDVGFAFEEDDFGKQPAEPSVKISPTSPFFGVSVAAPAVVEDEELPPPDDDFFVAPAQNQTQEAAPSTNPFPVESEESPVVPVNTNPFPTSNNPFPSNDVTETAPPNSKFDDLFGDAPASETTVTFGADDFFAATENDNNEAPNTDFKPFDEPLFDD